LAIPFAEIDARRKSPSGFDFTAITKIGAGEARQKR
jgi:hypothetical protein